MMAQKPPQSVRGLEMIGEKSIPESGFILLPNRLSYHDLLQLEAALAGRELTFLVEQDPPHDPLLHVPMRKVETDIRHNRRALTDEEFLKLVQAAEKSDKSVEGMTGPERSFLYAMARMTGLRRSELASLTTASFP